MNWNNLGFITAYLTVFIIGFIITLRGVFYLKINADPLEALKFKFKRATNKDKLDRELNKLG